MTKRLRVLGIDPGSRNLGYGVVDLDLDNSDVVQPCTYIEHMDSLLVDQVYKTKMDIRYLYSDRHQRLKACGDFVYSLCQNFKPDLVVIEDAYLDRRKPQSYRSLSEGIVFIEEAVMRYDETLPFLIISASTAKSLVGAKTFKGCDQKKVVVDAIVADINIIKPKNFLSKTEHAIDAVALAQSGCVLWWDENGCFYRSNPCQ